MGRTPIIRRVEAPILVVAEGADERRIIHELLVRREPTLDVTALGYPPRTAVPHVQIVSTGDRDFVRLGGLNPTIPSYGTVRRLILVFDAEEDPIGTLATIRANLMGSGLSLPSKAWEEAEDGGRTCVIAVLPDGSSMGSFEAMLLDGIALTHSGAEQLRCVEDFIACMGQDGDALTARQDKRRLYSWLSALDEPTRFAGVAAASGSLPLHTPQFERLVDLILGVDP